MNRRVIFFVAGLAIGVLATWFLYNRYRVVVPPVDTSKSEIGWSAKSVSDTHYGKIQLTKASLQFQNEALVGGDFEVDMKSITVEDITDEEHRNDFIKHIATGDFFETNTYPIATFKITSVKPIANASYEVVGDLKIKNVTKPIQFVATLKEENGLKKASAKIVVNRTLFGIEYGGKGKKGSQKDWFIYEDFILNVNIVSQ